MFVAVWFICFFFFSSRRRHTRWTGDWSSDVCSSDLSFSARATSGSGETSGFSSAMARRERASWLSVCRAMESANVARSEERRVGKEGRYRGGADHLKKKKKKRRKKEERRRG